MANFPVLKTGAVAQYPASRAIAHNTQVLRFVDGAEQRIPDQAGPLRRWVIELALLDETELAAVDAFLVSQQGRLQEFTFTDPWDGAEYQHCRLDHDAVALDLVREGFGQTTLIVQEVRS